MLTYSNIILRCLQVLELQNHMTSIEAFDEDLNTTVTMKDICFAPLLPDNDNCTIMSVLNYWQNSQENLDKEVWDSDHWYIMADYIDHMKACMRYRSKLKFCKHL